MSKMKKISLAVMLFSSVMSVTSPLLGQKDSVYAEETAQVVPAKEYRNVMYYGDWSIFRTTWRRMEHTKFWDFECNPRFTRQK